MASTEDRAAALLIARGVDPSRRVWGTGGWMPPDEREPLDWLTFFRFCGWNAHSVRPDADFARLASAPARRWIVLGMPSKELPEDAAARLETVLETEAIVLVTRAPSSGTRLARLCGASTGSTEHASADLRWIGPGPRRDWRCRAPVRCEALELTSDATTWAQCGGAPAIVARRAGRGVAVTLAFAPSEARDVDGAVTDLLRHLLVHGALAPVAWFDFTGTMVLRMDDPGGSQNVFLESWSYPKLAAPQWAAIGDALCRRSARLSVGYVPGWVDDGDRARGVLLVDGREPRRVPGAVHESPRVRYEDVSGHRPGAISDYSDEFRGIQALRAAGVAEVEMHGYTHLHPDREAWARAPDRYEAVRWYRELGKNASAAIAGRAAHEHPLAHAAAALERYFGVRPTALICPGDEWTDDALERALALDLQLVSSYYLALRDGDRFCWCSHVCAPYLDQPCSDWFDSGLPVVGYFHDYEPAVERPGWFSDCLEAWAAAGAKRWIDLRELAAVVGHTLSLEGTAEHPELHVRRLGAAPPFVRPAPVRVHFPGRDVPRALTVTIDAAGTTRLVTLEGGGEASVTVG